jgi:hypothetical protein
MGQINHTTFAIIELEFNPVALKHFDFRDFMHGQSIADVAEKGKSMSTTMQMSTDKLHARGPMGLEELTSYKFIVTGEGQLRE